MKYVPLLLPPLLLPALVGCGGEEIRSTWLDREIIIDGYEKDWQSAPDVDLGENLWVSASNDTAFLFLRLKTSHERLFQQILFTGMNLWIDDQGGKKRRFGIQFPRAEKRTGRGQGRSLNDTAGPDAMLRHRMNGQHQLKIPGGEKGQIRLMQNGGEKIEVRVGQSGRLYIYEAKLPLAFKDSWGYAYNLNPGKETGIGIETLKVKRDRRDGPGKGPGAGGIRISGPGLGAGKGGGMRGGGRGSMGGRGGMKGGHPRGGSKSQPPRQMKVWFKVMLAGDD